MVHYIGVLEPEYYEADVEVIPITYPFAGSHIWWPIERTDSLKLNFDFKSSKPIAVVASGDVKSNRGLGYWEVILLCASHIVLQAARISLIYILLSYVKSTTKFVSNWCQS